MVLVAACGSEDTPTGAECGEGISGPWVGDVAGDPFSLSIRLVNPLADCPGVGEVIEGSADLSGLALAGFGRLTQNPSSIRIRVALNPLSSWCPLSSSASGDALVLNGTVEDGLLEGTLSGGWLRPEATGECLAEPDTVLYIPATQVTLRR